MARHAEEQPGEIARLRRDVDSGFTDPA